MMLGREVGCFEHIRRVLGPSGWADTATAAFNRRRIANHTVIVDDRRMNRTHGSSSAARLLGISE
jgi:hypothetical protein